MPLRSFIKADDHVLRYSDEFANAEKLLAVASTQGLKAFSGKDVGWIKVKTATWREANKDRWETYEKRRPNP